MRIQLKRKEYKDYKEQYEKADYALAQVDGRLEKVNIGRRGKKAIELNLDQIKNIAKKLGVIQQYISKIENGHENFSVDTLARIADVLGKGLVIKLE